MPLKGLPLSNTLDPSGVCVVDLAAPQEYEFGGFRLDRGKRLLLDREGRPVSLNAKAFDTLVCFLEHPGQVLDRSSMIQALWPDTVVEENNLSQAVAAVRRALGDGFIATVTGRGYQFVAEVRTPAAAAEERSRSRWLWAAALVFVVAAMALAGLFWRPGTVATGSVSPSDRPSIAVLPFANESAAAENAAFFANGIHDELLTRLVKVRGLKVISRTSVEAYRDTPKSLRQIGRELGVSTVLEGRVQRAADRVRINVQLIDTESDEHLWAQTYDQELSVENLFAIQSEMALAIARALEAALTPQEVSLLWNVPTQSTRAYDFYLTGIDYFRNRTDPQHFIPLAFDALERAVDEDPDFASAWAVLSVLHSEMYWFYFDRTPERLEKAEQAARRALELGPDLPEIHLAMALFHYRSSLDYDAALTELAIAEKHCPECVEVLSLRGSINRRRGRFDLSMEDFDRVLERDPRNVFQLSAHLLVNYEYLRDYDQAAKTVERILELQPDDSTTLYERALLPLLESGDTARLREAAGTPRTADHGADWSVRVDLWTAALYDRDYDRAVALLESARGTSDLPPRGLLVGLAQGLAGQAELAATGFSATQAELERRLGEPLDFATEASLRVFHGYTLAALGQRDVAIAEVHRARTLLPKTRDALTGAWIQYHALFALALAGATEAAVDELNDYLLGYGPWSLEGLLPDPRLDPIREHPRFAALVARFDKRVDATAEVSKEEGGSRANRPAGLAPAKDG